MNLAFELLDFDIRSSRYSCLKSSVKAGIPAARRIFAQVRRPDSKDFFGPRTKLKSDKIRDSIEDEIRRKLVGTGSS